MAEATKYPQCPKGHEFAQNAGAYRVQPMGTRDLELISGWTVVYCRACGHIYQITPPKA